MVEDGSFHFVFLGFYPILGLLSVCIKLGSIRRGKISTANRVPSDGFIALVLIKGKGDE